jgi:hypothetical protein
MQRQERNARAHFWSRNTTADGTASLRLLTGLPRNIDLAFPSNRFAVIVSFAVTVALAIISRDGAIALLSGVTSFFAWALGRELDPDRPRTANLSAITVGLVLGVLAINDRLLLHDLLLGAIVTVALMVNARVMTRTTGLSATAFDAATLLAVAFGSVLVEPEVAVVLVALAALGIVLDRALEHHPYLANWCWFGFASFAFTGFCLLLNSGTWLLLTGLVFCAGTLSVVLSLKSKPSSRSDTGTKLEPSRIAVANMLGALSMTALASQGMPVALVGLLAVGLWSLWRYPELGSPKRILER